MESRLRHDLRHPISTISMIASTMAEFGDSVEEESLRAYGSQVMAELVALEQLIQEHDLNLELGRFRHLAEGFAASPRDVSLAVQLEAECKKVIERLATEAGA